MKLLPAFTLAVLVLAALAGAAGVAGVWHLATVTATGLIALFMVLVLVSVIGDSDQKPRGP